jgi:hypothetical protein
MLYIAVFVGFLFYGALYTWWILVQPDVNRPHEFFMVVRSAAWDTPSFNTLFLFKHLLIVITFYLVADTLISVVRRHRRRKPDAFVKALHSYEQPEEAFQTSAPPLASQSVAVVPRRLRFLSLRHDTEM